MAVVGTGAMGSRIAGRLLDSGYAVVVWNRTPTRAAPLVSRGAQAAASPADAARRSEVVIVMVADPDALTAVTEGPDGVAAGCAGSRLVIVMSTVGPSSLLRVATVLPAGNELVDAPVFGSLQEAETGSLTVFAGGSPELIETALPVLEVLGSVLRCGPLGSASAAKLVANAALLTAVCGLGEVLALGRRLELSEETVFEVLSLSPLAEQARRRWPSIQSGRYPPRFPVRLAAKDANLIAGLADIRAGEHPSALSAVEEWYTSAAQAGLGSLDYTAVLGHILHEASCPTSMPMMATPPHDEAATPDAGVEGPGARRARSKPA